MIYICQFQLCSHHRYWCGLYQYNALIVSIILTLVYSNKGFWSTAFMFNAKFASVISSRLCIGLIIRTIKFNTVTSFTRIRVNKLSRCISRIIRLFTRTSSTLFDYRIVIVYLIFEIFSCNRMSVHILLIRGWHYQKKKLS